jgi:hypothetical protein
MISPDAEISTLKKHTLFDYFIILFMCLGSALHAQIIYVDTNKGDDIDIDSFMEPVGSL